MKTSSTVSAVALVAAVAGIGVGVTSGASGANAASPTTSSTASSFTFGAAGDFGKNNSGTNAYNNFAAAGKAGLDFLQVDGDLSYSDPAKFSEQTWCNNVKSVMKNPVVLVAGNHESGLNPEKGHPNHGNIDNFVKPGCLPNRMKVTTSAGVSNSTAPNPANYGREFYFDYGQQAGTTKPLARMIYISAGEYLKNGELWSYKKGDAHYEWTKKAIADAHAAGIKWVIVSNHTNFVTVGHHGDEVGKDLYNMMLDQKVDMFLNGHDHTYQRSKQFAHTSTCSEMLSHQISAGCIVGDGKDGKYVAKKGMMQVIAGTGGADFHEAKADDTEWGYMSKVMGNDYQTYGFLKITVSQNSIKGVFNNVKGPFTDSFSIDDSSSSTPTNTPKPSTSPTTEPGPKEPTTTPTTTPSTGMASIAYTAVEDTSVDSSAPTKNFGKEERLYVDGSPTKRTYMKFNVSGVNGKKIEKVQLRINVTDASKSSQNITKVSGQSWSEASTIFNNRPGSTGTAVTVSNLPTGVKYIDLPVSDVTGDGTYQYGIHPKSDADTDGLDFYSREGGRGPQLVVTYAK